MVIQGEKGIVYNCYIIRNTSFDYLSKAIMYISFKTNVYNTLVKDGIITT